ncbi:VOC family protein [Microbacterium sp. No. 7]|uniref:VOC family protein n=1 Tax=Microbacterium sp. No. 7 TaxID=1714373 RepID=UPI0006CFFE1F|nr:VOC family protein [Microbacterium sp. No. 7]ALJ18943.1 hypothetical protein AOA12_03075 [Microbacterium sp. No. 7]
MKIDRLDHLVLTVADIPTTVAFYATVLGMTPHTYAGTRTALLFGPHKINLHQADEVILPRAAHPAPGSADVCLVVDGDLSDVEAELHAHGVPIVEGPVARQGAQGPMRSVYVRDPDGNLVELSSYG